MLIRREDGKYTASRLMKHTMKLIEVVADTGDKAQELLKEEIEKYRDGLRKMLPTVIVEGARFHSPGYGYYKDEFGGHHARFTRDRQGIVWCRPEILDLVRKENTGE